VTPGAVEAAIPAGAAIVLDTSTILAYLSGAEAGSEAAASILDGCVATGRNEAIASTVTVTEALVRPMRAESPTAVRLVEDFLGRFANLRLEPVTVAIAREAARIRAATAAPTHDALILATATITMAPIVVGNDASWPAIVARAGLACDVVILSRLSTAS
jgi:predicted nucleic acid-binding protein